MFNSDSQIVKIWVRLVNAGTYTREKVPRLGNLQDVVYEALDASKNKEGETRM